MSRPINPVNLWLKRDLIAVSTFLARGCSTEGAVIRVVAMLPRQAQNKKKLLLDKKITFLKN